MWEQKNYNRLQKEEAGILRSKKMKELKQIIYGEYVATPIKNAFNNKTAYWLSKKDCTIAVYMFTVESWMQEKDIEAQLDEQSLCSYIKLFEEKQNQKGQEDLTKAGNLSLVTVVKDISGEPSCCEVAGIFSEKNALTAKEKIEKYLIEEEEEDFEVFALSLDLNRLSYYDLNEMIPGNSETKDINEENEVTLVLNATTKRNSSSTHGEFVQCLNCRRIMLVDLGTVANGGCPECNEESLEYFDYIHPEKLLTGKDLETEGFLLVNHAAYEEGR